MGPRRDTGRPLHLRRGIRHGGGVQVHGHGQHRRLYLRGGHPRGAVLGLVICFLTGAFFREAALAAAAYVLFLAFAFHGPSHWSGNQTEFGFFVDHFTFIAGLLFAAVHGPGDLLGLSKLSFLGARPG